MHPILLKVHMAAVVLSLLVFLGRAVLTFAGSELARKKAVLMLAMATMVLVVLTAAGLAVSLGQFPFVDGWLTEKFIGLLVYIVLAIASLKPGVATVKRIPMIALSLAGFALAMSVAVTRTGFIF